MYPAVKLYIDGEWCEGEGQIEVLNPATGRSLGQIAKARLADVDAAVVAAERAFAEWKAVPVFERAKIIRRAADILRERAEEIGRLITLENGKPLAQGVGEVRSSADILDWAAEEGRRVYDQVLPAREAGVRQVLVREPLGVIAAFTPWNFPVSQCVRKIGPALAAGCTVVLKAAEDTPASPAELVRAFADAGLPKGVLNLLYGDPAEISGHLIPQRAVKKVSFTGSIPVGKKLAALAGEHMKRVTMELGGHAPVFVTADADIEAAAKLFAGSKMRNAGQVCVSPTRFLVEDPVYDSFVARFAEIYGGVKVGDGLESGTEMGPLVNLKRREAVEGLVAEALEHGARLVCGGTRLGNEGYFYAPTVLADVTPQMRIANEEPFGPVALMMRMPNLDAMVAEGNRLNIGLAGYAYTGSRETAERLAGEVQVGMLTVNHIGLAAPEVPFGGINDSGYGTEGGPEVLDAYLMSRFVTRKNI